MFDALPCSHSALTITSGRTMKEHKRPTSATVRVDLPEELKLRIKRAAEYAEVSVSQWFCVAAKHQLTTDEARREEDGEVE
jgi:hypothetical protein